MSDNFTNLRLHNLATAVQIRQAQNKPLGFWLRLMITIELIRLVGPPVVAAVVLGALVIVVVLA